jgi:ribosomal protein S18 acetylase RimI-like enzyme
MNDFCLRRYQRGDEAAILALHERALRQVDAYLPGPWNDDLENIPSSYLQHRGAFLVGVIEDRIVAMGALRSSDASRAEIKRMRVDPAYQGRGYGRAILLALEARAKEMGYTVLHLDTTREQLAAIHLYRNHGYIQTGTRLFLEMELLLFEKQLTDL